MDVTAHPLHDAISERLKVRMLNNHDDARDWEWLLICLMRRCEVSEIAFTDKELRSAVPALCESEWHGDTMTLTVKVKWT